MRATPDGYTLAFVSGAYTTMAAVHKLPYDPVKDITPIVLVGEASSIAVVHPSVPVKSIKELVAYAKANPGKLNYGSGGTGGFSHLLVGLFELMANVRMTHIPYKGTGPALTDLLGGQLQVIFGSTPSTAPHVKSGRLRALGVTSKERSSALPDVPPIAETVPGYYAPLLYGMWGPKGLPAEVVALWNREVVRLIRTPDMADRFISEQGSMRPAARPPNFAMLCATNRTLAESRESGKHQGVGLDPQRALPSSTGALMQPQLALIFAAFASRVHLSISRTKCARIPAASMPRARGHRRRAARARNRVLRCARSRAEAAPRRRRAFSPARTRVPIGRFVARQAVFRDRWNFGRCGQRLTVVTASARSLPARINGSALDMPAKLKSDSPLDTATIAAGAPL